MIKEFFSFIFEDGDQKQKFLDFLIQEKIHFSMNQGEELSTEYTKKKKCKSCGEEKFLAEFFKAKNGKDGRRGKCKTCERLEKFQEMKSKSKNKK